MTMEVNQKIERLRDARHALGLVDPKVSEDQIVALLIEMGKGQGIGPGYGDVVRFLLLDWLTRRIVELEGD